MKFLNKLFPARSAKTSGVVSPATNVTRALDVGRTRILYVEGHADAGQFDLSKLEIIPLGPEAPLAIGLKTLFDEKKCSRLGLRVSLKSPQVVCRFLRFPKMTEKQLRGVLQYEIEQYVPYEAKDLYLDLATLDESVKTEQGEFTEVFVAVAKKDSLDSLVKQFQDAQAEVEIVDVDMLACMKCLEFFHSADFAGHVAILDLGVQVTTLGVVREGQPKFIRDLSFGSQDIIKKLKSRAVVSDAAVADFISGKLIVDESMAPVFVDSIENLINDVKVSFDFYRDQAVDSSGVDRIYVCGISSSQAFVLQMLQKAIDVPVVNMDLMSKIKAGPDVSMESLTANIADLPVALGLMLTEND